MCNTQHMAYMESGVYHTQHMAYRESDVCHIAHGVEAYLNYFQFEVDLYICMLGYNMQYNANESLPILIYPREGYRSVGKYNKSFNHIRGYQNAGYLCLIT